MKFYIVFKPSGDVIPLETDKPDLLQYYKGFLEQCCANRFSLIPGQQFSSLEQLRKTLETFNQSIVGKLVSFDCPDDELDLLDQDLLNKIHCEWTHSNHIQLEVCDLQEKYSEFWHLFNQITDDIAQVGIPQICYKYDLQELYGAINTRIHQVESIFDKMYFQAAFDRDWGWIETKNIFPKKYTSNSVANLCLRFQHPGRHLHDKFSTFDLDLTYDDENTFNQLLGFIQLSMVPPETIAYSPEYLAWCHKVNREPGGEAINIGNIIDLGKNLFDYRKLVYKNLFVDKNFFELSF